MKDKIFTFIIGLLIGAILATSGFLLYTKTIQKDTEESIGIQMDERRNMNGSVNGKIGEPPDKDNRGKIPEMNNL